MEDMIYVHIDMHELLASILFVFHAEMRDREINSSCSKVVFTQCIYMYVHIQLRG